MPFTSTPFLPHKLWTEEELIQMLPMEQSLWRVKETNPKVSSLISLARLTENKSIGHSLPKRGQDTGMDWACDLSACKDSVRESQSNSQALPSFGVILWVFKLTLKAMFKTKPFILSFKQALSIGFFLVFTQLSTSLPFPTCHCSPLLAWIQASGFTSSGLLLFLYSLAES